jgi:glutathione-regulated potassium-efflux system ancillary protein KefC
MDLLESAGVARAKLLLVAIDDPEAAMRLVKRVRQRYPALQLMVRAHSRTDAYEYAELGVPVVREVFASALEAASKLLVALSYEPDNAQRIIERFREYDERQIAESAPHRHDVKKLIALTEQGRRDIAQLLAGEAASAPQIDKAA